MTGCDRVLHRLQQGPASHLELYALGVVAHSRISDLRKRGHHIEQTRDGDLYIYRLLSEEVVEAHPCPCPPATSSLSGPTARLANDTTCAAYQPQSFTGRSQSRGESKCHTDQEPDRRAAGAGTPGRVAPEPGLAAGQLSLLALA